MTLNAELFQYRPRAGVLVPFAWRFVIADGQDGRMG
jgi:hypothetical protein